MRAPAACAVRESALHAVHACHALPCTSRQADTAACLPRAPSTTPSPSAATSKRAAIQHSCRLAQLLSTKCPRTVHST